VLPTGAIPVPIRGAAASFFVTNSLVQNEPDQPTLSMGNGPDGLIVSQARD
jgi:hypothetical protein